MPRVINTKPNAPDMIDGLAFEPHDLGKISPEISEEAVARYLTIPGYQAEPVKGGEQAEPEAPVSRPDPGAELTRESYAQMRVPHILDLLDASPDMAGDVAAFEAERARPRKAIIDRLTSMLNGGDVPDTPGAVDDPGT